MLGLGKKGAVEERKASGELERVYHEIKQILRVTGVNLNFRTWAQYDRFLPLVWDSLRPNLETRAFEEAADALRAEAVDAARTLGPLGAREDASLGPSQDYQVRAALELYHYVNPKLLILTSAVKLAITGHPIEGNPTADRSTIARGAPDRMFPMEMESDSPSDKRLKEIFADIKQTLSLPSVNSDYRTLALWPDYLASTWRHLKPIVLRDEYERQATELRHRSRTFARQLPYGFALDRQAIEDAGHDLDEVADVTNRFEQLLPGLIINIALCANDWPTDRDLSQSPFPAADRTASNPADPSGVPS